MAIKAVFFDAAGTLIKPARRVGESYVVIAAKYGIDVSPAAISERFRACFDAATPLAFPGAATDQLAALERQWWKQLVRRVFEPWDRFTYFDDYFAELYAYFAQPDAWTLYPEVLDTLAALKERGLILDVISNFDSRLLEILRGVGAALWFDQIFVSSRVGYAKPHREIFHAALNHHGLSAPCAVHVGDSEENDLHGANQAGLKGILIDRGSQTPSATGLRVSSLKEILWHLDV
jgi:putative hydrolase of the HAD superfamily